MQPFFRALKTPALIGVAAFFLHIAAGLDAMPVDRSVQLQVQHAPRLARIGGETVLAYEVHMTNRSHQAIQVERVVVTDVRTGVALTMLEDTKLAVAIHGDTGKAPAPTTALEAGAQAVVYLWIRLDSSRSAPANVLTRIELSSRGQHAAVGVLADVSNAPAVTLAPPLAGGPWVAVYGPDLDRGHRRVFYTQEGRARIPGRFAVDWFKVDTTGRMFDGERKALKHWFGYGADVLAVADARVAAALDGRPDRNFGPRPAVHDPMQGSGNYIALDLGDGRFAFYEHLKPGSVRVRQGDTVRRGQVIAALGDSGDTAGPHLHFHVADANAPLGAEGTPFVIDRFQQLGAYPSIQASFAGVPWPASAPVVMRGELPAANAVVRFGQPGAASP